MMARIRSRWADLIFVNSRPKLLPFTHRTMAPSMRTGHCWSGRNRDRRSDILTCTPVRDVARHPPVERSRIVASPSKSSSPKKKRRQLRLRRRPRRSAVSASWSQPETRLDLGSCEATDHLLSLNRPGEVGNVSCHYCIELVVGSPSSRGVTRKSSQQNSDRSIATWFMPVTENA